MGRFAGGPPGAGGFGNFALGPRVHAVRPWPVPGWSGRVVPVLNEAARPLARLGVALFFAQSAFNIYGASLPLYFAGLGFDPTLIGLLIGATGVAELLGALAVGPGIDRFGARTLLLAGAGRVPGGAGRRYAPPPPPPPFLLPPPPGVCPAAAG